MMDLYEAIYILKSINEMCSDNIECDKCPFFIEEDNKCKLETQNGLVPYQWTIQIAITSIGGNKKMTNREELMEKVYALECDSCEECPLTNLCESYELFWGCEVWENSMGENLQRSFSYLKKQLTKAQIYDIIKKTKRKG